jgi:NADH-quinone oxidoreductase subunit J
MILAAEYLVAQNVFFGLIALLMVIAAVRVVTTRNVVHAALWLVVVFGGMAAQFILLASEFVATVQVLVYIGAIIVLFLFGLMLTKAQLGTEDDLDNNQKGMAAVIGVALLGVLGYGLWDYFGDGAEPVQSLDVQRTAEVSDVIFGPQLVAFEVISVLLLAALIGAIVLARRD